MDATTALRPLLASAWLLTFTIRLLPARSFLVLTTDMAAS